MKPFVLFVLLGLSLSLTSCQAVGELIRTGFWAGFVIASLLWGIIMYLVKTLF